MSETISPSEDEDSHQLLLGNKLKITFNANNVIHLIYVFDVGQPESGRSDHVALQLHLQLHLHAQQVIGRPD